MSSIGLYTDFDISFKLNENGDISLLSDEGCIRQVIRNSIALNSYEIPFNKWYAVNIKKYLFENPDKITEMEIKKSISDVLLLDERLRDPEIVISYSADYQTCIIEIKVYVILLDKMVSEKIYFENVR